ncbi:MAG TPA: hypothetical protein VFD36_14050 [Kofleriaceae bacterium]|nr:hypothetical protein [Kofleriaceae bacterium]
MMIRLIPKFVMTVTSFAARDPWNAGRETRFQIDAYVQVPELNPNMRVSKHLPLQRYLLALQPAGGELHMLPESLAELWRRKEVAEHRLPAMLHAIEPALTRKDYRIYLVTWPLMLYAATVAVLLGAVGVMAAITLGPGPQPKEPMYVLFALAVVAPATIVAIAARRRGLRMRQMQALRAQL